VFSLKRILSALISVPLTPPGFGVDGVSSMFPIVVPFVFPLFLPEESRTGIRDIDYVT